MIDKNVLNKLILEGKTVKECSLLLGVSPTTIKRYRKEYGLSNNIILRKYKCERCENIVEISSIKEKDKVYCSRSCSSNKYSEFYDSGKFSISKFISGRWELYSYLYGLYLGDGCVYLHKKGVYGLMIALDMKYPKLINEVYESLSTFHNNKVQTRIRYVNCCNLTIYGKYINVLFPKFGIGNKYKNMVFITKELQDNLCYKSLLKGLFQSDGSYYYDNYNDKYFYNFTNMSVDIINIFIMCLNNLDIKYTLNIKKNNVYVVYIRRINEVEKMMKIVGIKK